MLHEFVTLYRKELISRCEVKALTRPAPPPTNTMINHGVPMFLDELVDELRLGLSSNPDISKTATKHGHDLLRQGFTASQVVHGYGDVCQAITELAVEVGAPISTDDFRMLNRCLDDAIAAAVTAYGREGVEPMKDSEEPIKDNGEVAAETVRLEDLARDLRNSIYSAVYAFEALRSGSVGVAGATGQVLDRSLSSAHGLVGRLLGQLDDAPLSSRPVPAEQSAD
jgi:hypothetical protein